MSAETGRSEIRERFRTGLEAWNRGDLEAVLDLFHPDIEYDDSRREIEPDVYRGRDAVRRHFIDNLLATWEELRIDVDETVDLGPERLLTVLRMRGTGRGSQIPVDATIACLWHVRDGRAVRMEYFGSRDEAIAAAGGTAQEP